MTETHPTVAFAPVSPDGPDALAAAKANYEFVRQRRSVRDFSDRAVPREVIEYILLAAGTAPSGANKQPWRFVAVQDPALKHRIRVGAEDEEREFYEHRAPERWLRDLAPLQTDWHKPFLETAPWLIVIFKLMKDDSPGRLSDQMYYVNESVGIATGMLLDAVHRAGLVALTHTPSPMSFLGRILDRPEHERPYLLVPVGHPTESARVPDIHRKSLDETTIIAG